jgi:hypothetical protein
VYGIAALIGLQGREVDAAATLKRHDLELAA